MKWTPRGYARQIVFRGELVLRGWPVSDGIPFANLSKVKGGAPVMEYLLRLWETGRLRFEAASEDEVETAYCNYTSVFPDV